MDRLNDKILEIATLVTDGNLNIIAEVSFYKNQTNVIKAPTYCIHWDDDILDNMGEWCMEQHTKSGLIQDCKKSELSLKEAETLVVNFLEKYTIKGANPIAGSSIHCDKAFIDIHMPLLSQHLYYRIIDVSSIRELAL